MVWTISKKRCVQLSNKSGYYHTNSHFARQLTLPMRYDCESLEYSLDISGFLQDSQDYIQSISAMATDMELIWLSYAHQSILFGLKGGKLDQTGHLYCYFRTIGGRSLQIELVQSVLVGKFPQTDPPLRIIPNLLQFSNTQPLSSSDEAFFFFR